MTSFSTTLLILLKSIEVVSNLPISNLSTALFKLLKPIGKFLRIYQYLICPHKILNELNQSF